MALADLENERNMTGPPEHKGLKFFEEDALVAVLTTQPIDRFLDYKAPAGGLALGAMVEVPLGPRRVLGVVWGPGEGAFDPAKIRKVLRVIDLPPMRPEMMTFPDPGRRLHRLAHGCDAPPGNADAGARRRAGNAAGAAARRWPAGPDDSRA